MSATCRRHAARVPLFAAVAWLAAALGSLSVAAVPHDPGHGVCGVWGCYPPFTALAAMHLFWLVNLAAAGWAISRWLPGLVRPAGFLLVLTALVAAVPLVGGDLTAWREGLSAADQRYWPQRLLYRVANLTDVPLVQAVAVGTVMMLAPRRRVPGRTRSGGPALTDDDVAAVVVAQI